jgi:carotenoid cleavage dioxygenase-like enzyme
MSTTVPTIQAASPIRREQKANADRTNVPPTGNLFLDGAFAPVKEETTAHRPKVRGELPKDLNGLYVRIGPNPLKPPKAAKHHWFAGDGMVHGLKLNSGEAEWYRNRYIGSASVQKALGRPTVPGETRGIFDTVNTNVYGHAGRIWASVEAGPAPVQLDGELNSVRHGLFDSPTQHPFSAHPHLDPISGDLHAVCYDAIKHRQLSYVRVNAQGSVDKVVHIPVKHGPMVHDCAITRSQVIVLDLPVTFSWMSLLKRETFPYAWNSKHKARVGLLPRDGGADDIRWYDIDPCYVFHPCNAFDLPDGSVVLDVVAHKHMFDQSRVGPEGDTQPRFERWTLPAQGTQVKREVICERSQEFPRLNETLVGQPYRYAYAAEFTADQAGGQHLLKHDLHTRQTTALRLGPDLKLGEFVFVPRTAELEQAAGSQSAQELDEDDGWLIGYAFDLRSGLGEFHVINAKTMTSQAVVEIPAPIPMGFHGNWVADEAMKMAKANTQA